MTIAYRQLDANGDYVFGRGPGQFLTDSPDAVAQAVLTRLGLAAGEWFLDVTEGTPYSTKILGERTQPFYDQAIQQRILGTLGVTSIQNYASFLDGNRILTVQCTINTLFGAVPLTVVL